MVNLTAKISCMTLIWLQVITWVIGFWGKVVPEVARVVLRNKKRRTAALLFPLLHYQLLSNAQVLFPRFRNRLWPALPLSEESARTAGATNTMLQHQSHSWSHSTKVRLFTQLWDGYLLTLNFQQHLCSGAIFCRLSWRCRHTHAELLRGWILLVYLVVMQRASVTWGSGRSAGNTRRNVNMEGKNTFKTLQEHVKLHFKSNH